MHAYSVCSFFYTGAIHAVSEIDGVRIIGSDACDFIQKVPVSSMSIFRPGSTSPSAILYDAWEGFSRRSLKVEENIRSIRHELSLAVDDCIDAAGQEWEPYWQRRLLNACDDSLQITVLADLFLRLRNLEGHF